VPRRGTNDDRLYATRWVHVFEEDDAAGAVYRPAEDKIPLSRRPREQFELRPDGSARLFVAGADDRPAGLAATWRDEGGTIVIRSEQGGRELRIVKRTRDRLTVESRPGQA
jgi:hypothetical protein